MFKSILLTLSLSMFGLASAFAQRVDPVVLSHASCAMAEPLSPEIAAFRVLEMSQVLTRDKVGNVMLYGGMPDPEGGFLKVFNTYPSRVAVATKKGVPYGLIGSRYSKEAQIADVDILKAFAKGLQRDFTMMPFDSPLFKQTPVFAYAGMSDRPVAGESTHLLLIGLTTGERLVFCAPKAMLNRMLF